jgi:hypothetical protein
VKPLNARYSFTSVSTYGSASMAAAAAAGRAAWARLWGPGLWTRRPGGGARRRAPGGASHAAGLPPEPALFRGPWQCGEAPCGLAAGSGGPSALHAWTPSDLRLRRGSYRFTNFKMAIENRSSGIRPPAAAATAPQAPPRPLPLLILTACASKAHGHQLPVHSPTSAVAPSQASLPNHRQASSRPPQPRPTPFLHQPAAMSGKGAKGLAGKGAKGTMHGVDKSKAQDKKKPTSRSARAGLQFPVGRVHRLLKVRWDYLLIVGTAHRAQGRQSRRRQRGPPRSTTPPTPALTDPRDRQRPCRCHCRGVHRCYPG